MNISAFSGIYSVRPLTDDGVDAVYALCRENPMYYRYCPPFVTRESVVRDMKALPPGKQMRDKYYLGFFDHGDLIAVLDLIDGYPEPVSAFIGFFMVRASLQHKNIGSRIITDLCEALKARGFEEVRLCWADGNPQAESFWKKNGFAETGLSYAAENYTVIIARRVL